MNCLLLYSNDSGNKDFYSLLPEIQNRLSKHYDVLDVVCPKSKEEAFSLIESSCGHYHSLVVAGGDGTFNNAISALVGKKDAPIIGYINNGTMGDCGKNFGVNSKLSKALEIIEKGNFKEFDIGECNGHYFSYMAAIGCFSDISYIVPRGVKKKFGKLAYYKEAIVQAFHKQNITVEVNVDSKTYKMKTPFLLIMNGKNVGGFPVNSKGNSHDGKMEVFITKPGLFNGLIHYFFHLGVTKISSSSFTIKASDTDMPWCLDGEIGPFGDASFMTHPAAIRVFTKL